MNPRVLILGGGISGLSLAWRLQSFGFETVLLEKNSQTGGLAGTVRQGGYCLDYGPHSFFTEDIEVRESVLSLFNPPLEPASRSVRFYFQGKYLDYPFTPAGLFTQMGPAAGLQAGASYLLQFTRQRVNSKDAANEDVETWAVKNFGPYLYKAFFKPYTEQFWRYPCRELSARTLPTHTRLSFAKALGHIFFKKGNPSQLDRESLQTYYPQTGYGEIAELIAAKVLESGGKIILNASARRLQFESSGRWNAEWDRRGTLEEMTFDHVVSTIPLRSLIGCLEPAPPTVIHKAAQALKFRPIVTLGMVTRRERVLPASYVYTLHRPYNRITDMNQFSPKTSPDGFNVAAVEIPCRPGTDDFFRTPELLFEECLPSLEADGILRRSEVEGLILAKAPDAYPVYLKDYAAPLALLQEFIQHQPGLSLLGRTAEFRYMDADQCIRRAFDLAGKLAERYEMTGEQAVHANFS